MRRYKKWLTLIISVLASSFVILQASIVTAPHFISNPGKSDAIIILGHALKDGYNPASWLESRLEKGLELYNAGYADYIIVSGGKGPTDNIPVSTAMKNWLVKQGIPSGIILEEDKAHSTYENIEYSKKLLAQIDAHSTIIVTSDFHLFRSVLIARNELANTSSCHSFSDNFPEKLLAYIREALAVIKYVVFGN